MHCYFCWGSSQPVSLSVYPSAHPCPRFLSTSFPTIQMPAPSVPDYGHPGQAGHKHLWALFPLSKHPDPRRVTGAAGQG